LVGLLAVATISTRSASSSRGERSSTIPAISTWSLASATITAGGASAEAPSASASARRTSGEGSSSDMTIAPSAAMRSSDDRSE
jgi:hypothetical protein